MTSLTRVCAPEANRKSRDTGTGKKWANVDTQFREHSQRHYGTYDDQQSIPCQREKRPDTRTGRD